ncbi:VCBS repeat-containing protein [Sulfitobacter sp. SK012]|uniref:FG-GAP repeat domain-containing protein n=1 Tax=Sulfitobacter sp. SK012 TaxID=1389005 RepID=UPI000E0C1AA1|nr:VCBS repeat-containing protein [Sulfitobacter sp. SK012]AXI47388.1 VCBS repeat-containing protein [Sulfitobacter sp. SK012]
MRTGARRLLTGMLPRSIRRAQLTLCAVLAFQGPAISAELWQTEPLSSARYTEPTTRYPHGALGDETEFGALELSYGSSGSVFTIRLPSARVFEDIEPRLVDIDGDGRDEALTIESHQNEGARLAIYNGGGLIAATPYIGRRFRWLAPIGAADLDGDGHVEIAYIDRPHLAKTLRIWRYIDGALTEVASLGGLTNHRFGAHAIEGGIRTCGSVPEMIVASSDWQRMISVTFDGKSTAARDIGAIKNQNSLTQALACK